MLVTWSFMFSNEGLDFGLAHLLLSACIQSADVIDLNKSTDDTIRLRTCIFPGEQTYIYVSKELSETLWYQLYDQ